MRELIETKMQWGNTVPLGTLSVRGKIGSDYSLMLTTNDGEVLEFVASADAFRPIPRISELEPGAPLQDAGREI